MLLPVMLTVTVIAVCGLMSVSGSGDCQSTENMKVIQTVCKKENEAIVFAENVRDSEEICRHFHLVLKCAVSALPHCYTYVESLFAHYTHSPFSCELTQQLIMDLQAIYMKNIQGNRSTAPESTDSLNTSQPGGHFTRPAPDNSSETEESVESTLPTENGAHRGDKQLGGKDNAAAIAVSGLPVTLLLLVASRLFS